MNTPYVIVASAILLLAALSVPLVKRWVPPNPLYGVRTAATAANPQVWYEANARAGKELCILAVIALLVLTAGAIVSDRGPSGVGATAVFLGLGSVVVALRAWRFARRLHSGR